MKFDMASRSPKVRFISAVVLGFALTLVKERQDDRVLVSKTVGEGGAFDAKPDIPGVERSLVASLDTLLKKPYQGYHFEARWYEINQYCLHYDLDTRVLTYTLEGNLDVARVYRNVTPDDIHTVAMKNGRASTFDTDLTSTLAPSHR